MNEHHARLLLLVRAIESDDTSASLLTREDRQHATSTALTHIGSPHQRDAINKKRQHDAFLSARAEAAFRPLAQRFPAVGQACRSAQWPRWINWALPLAALVLGVASNELAGGRRLNIIAFPLLGMLAWNLVVYATMLAHLLRSVAPRKHSAAAPSRLARWLEPIMRPARAHLDARQPLGRALIRFAQDWLLFSAGLTYHRISRTLHLSAALLAAGVLLGMYLRALGVEYRAGWESTFINAPTLHRLISIVLGPASALTGIALPNPELLDALRWNERGGGENAGAWIHLYATTAALFIIGPRLLFTAWHALRALQLRRRFPIPGASDVYVRRLLRSATGSESVVQVVPYSFHPPERAQQQLQRLLTDVLGDQTRMVLDTPIPYGGEDEWLAGAPLDASDADHLVVLFHLSATPEAENQGALVAGIRRHLAQHHSGASVLVLLDESAYRQRLAGQNGAEQRIASRRLAWETMLGQLDVKPLSLDLDASDIGTLARRLEAALLQTPEHAEGAA